MRYITPMTYNTPSVAQRSDEAPQARSGVAPRIMDGVRRRGPRSARAQSERQSLNGGETTMTCEQCSRETYMAGDKRENAAARRIEAYGPCVDNAYAPCLHVYCAACWYRGPIPLARRGHSA